MAVKMNDLGLPVPVTEDLLGSVNLSNKQSTHQTMKKGWNRCPTQKQGDGTDDAPRKVEWTCLGLHETLWRGLALCHGGVSRDHSVPPNTTRSTRQAFSVWVTRHFDQTGWGSGSHHGPVPIVNEKK